MLRHKPAAQPADPTPPGALSQEVAHSAYLSADGIDCEAPSTMTGQSLDAVGALSYCGLRSTPQAGPFGASFRIDEIAAEARPEALGVIALGEAENGHVDAVMPKGVAAVAEREALAEETHRHVVAAAAVSGRQGDLGRPAAVDAGRRFEGLCGR
jgi:hypothetical protein